MPSFSYHCYGSSLPSLSEISPHFPLKRPTASSFISLSQSLHSSHHDLCKQCSVLSLLCQSLVMVHRAQIRKSTPSGMEFKIFQVWLLNYNSNLQPVTQINSPTKPNYFQFPFCSHCFKLLFFAHAVSDIRNDSSHYMPCCVPAKFILKNLVLVSLFWGIPLLNMQTFSPPSTHYHHHLTFHCLCVSTVFCTENNFRTMVSLVDILYNGFMPVPQATYDEDPTELAPEQYNYQSQQ